jgi:membrane protease YdiL (CAAX protease family)
MPVGAATTIILIAMAAAPAASPDAEQTIAALTQRVSSAQTTAYEAALHEFDALLASHPTDLGLHLAKCRFIQSYAWSEDVTIERAEDDYDQCRQQLQEGPLAQTPGVQLFLVEQQYGEEAAANAEALLESAKTWNRDDRARLYELFASRIRATDGDRADRYAAQAVADNPYSRLRVDVAETWFSKGLFDKSRGLIESTPADAWEKMSVYNAAVLLLRAGAPTAAAGLLRDQSAKASDTRLQMLHAAALGEAGDVVEARKLFDESLAKSGKHEGMRELRRHVQFELAHGDREQALAAYTRFRDLGYAADPFARYRLELTARHPLAAWQWRDALGVMTLLLMLAGIASAPGLLLAGVHYRSLAKRVRGIQPLEGRWHLGHIWYALALFMLGGVVASYLFGYSAFAAIFSSSNLYKIDPLYLDGAARMILAEVVMVALCLVPLLRTTDLRTLFLGNKRLLPTIGWALLAFLVARIATVLYLPIHRAVLGAAVGDLTTFSIQSVQYRYGQMAAVGLVAALVPVVEEFVFRGVVLQGLSRYIKFWWAALIQAGLFTLMHESVAAMPMIFLLGLIAAWLVRRTGGLLAPILFHAVNNLVAVAAIGLATDFASN